jgi:hypothetical protein
MKPLQPLMDALAAESLYVPDDCKNRPVAGVFASDLISDILVSEGEDILLVTSLLSEQVLHTAGVIGASAVVLVNRKQIPLSLIRSAEKQKLPLFHAVMPTFEACVRLGRAMEDA